jgi:uncharacterized RDD family membrane protein YckC
MVATFTTALFFSSRTSELTPSLTRLGIFFLEVGLLTALTGASIGQRIMKIRVVTAIGILANILNPSNSPTGNCR